MSSVTASAGRRRTRAASAARGVWGVSTLLMLGGIVVQSATSRFGDESAFEHAAIVAAFAAFSLVGMLVTTRHARNSLGWVYLAIGLFAGIGSISEPYAHYSYGTTASPLPFAWIAAWIQSWFWYPTIILVMTFGLLLFPDGRLPSRRWRPILWAAWALLAIFSVLGAFAPQLDVPGGPPLDNPLGLHNITDVEKFLAPLDPVALLLPLASAASLFFRFRRGRAEERQQIKWFAVAALLFTIVLALGELADIPEIFFPLFLILLPASVGVAILKYHLYDIDVIINRTLVYAAVTVALGATYFFSTVMLQRVLPLSRDSDVAVAASTLAVAALFRPLRSRVQEFIDRRFYRSKYDAAQTLSDFAARLRQRVELDSVQHEVLNVAATTMKPAHVSLWIRSPIVGSEARDG